LNDEETFLFMTTLSRGNIFDSPVFKLKRKLDFFNADEMQIAIRNALVVIVKTLAKEYHSKNKTKEECLKEYKILTEVIIEGYKQYRNVKQ